MSVKQMSFLRSTVAAVAFAFGVLAVFAHPAAAAPRLSPRPPVAAGCGRASR